MGIKIIKSSWRKNAEQILGNHPNKTIIINSIHPTNPIFHSSTGQPTFGAKTRL